MSGGVIWITGLSASGKTTLARNVSDKLAALEVPHLLLDGDILRNCLNVQQQHSRSERLAIGHTYARIAKMISEQNIIVVIGVIALFKELHKWNRENIHNYFEVFLDTPMPELEHRDSKNLYKNFREGTITNVAGLDVQVDFPENPNYLVEFNPSLSSIAVSKNVLQSFFDFQKTKSL
jgi:cytidine diphosphoramidate kinase